ncbi:MAG: ATP-dependent Clp protease ATP-binding subunit, partial [Prevotella sp.]|nr:ATP-dependent Clp protease ATP-binding subunit [Prevotella sp.]
SKHFSPEFLNRMDDIITFDQLDLEAIKKIVDIELRDLNKRIEGLGYHMTVTDEAKTFVATKGYDVQFGARPLKRAIQTHIEDGVCEMLIDETLKPGMTIQVDKDPDHDKLIFQVK